MSSTDIIYSIADAFQWAFLFYDNIGNLFNDFLLLLGFFGFFYWMNIQKKLNEKSNVPVEVKNNVGWYKDESGKQLK
jgi:hypothetical protein